MTPSADRLIGGVKRKAPFPGPFCYDKIERKAYIMPSMPPIPPMPPPPPAASSFGSSATMASVVIMRPATDAAFCSAVRVTLVGIEDAHIQHVAVLTGGGKEGLS